MWTAAARAKSQRRVTVQCYGRQTQLERPAIRAGQPNYCDACKAGRQRQLNAEWYAANREQALRRDAG